MAQSVPEPAPWRAGSPGFAAEFERLAGRSPTEAECEVACRAQEESVVWANGLLPEGLVHLAAALACGEGKRILFVSPQADLIELRQLRLGTRAPAYSLSTLIKGQTTKSLPEAFVTWIAPGELERANILRVFGRAGPDIVLVEDAQAALSASFHYRPSFSKVAGILSQFPKTRLVLSTRARGHALRPQLAAAFKIADSQGTLIEEDILSGPDAPCLQVVKDESTAIAAIVGPLPRPCVVLCSTPAQADQVYAHLESEQVPVHRYHAAIPESIRARELLHFALPGRRAVLVTVSSFGPQGGLAGVKSSSVQEEFGHGYARRDLRSMVHLCAPCSLDQYIQELSLLRQVPHSGQRSFALMLYNPAHLALNLALLERKRPTPEALGAVVDALLAAPRGGHVEMTRLGDQGSVSTRNIALIIDFLEDLELVERSGPLVKTRVTAAELRAKVKVLREDFASLLLGDEPRAQEVHAFAESEQCRIVRLKEALGLKKALGLKETPGLKGAPGSETGLDASDAAEACGRCDVCDPSGYSSLSQESRALGHQAPTIEARRAKRHAPVRPHDDHVDAEDDDFFDDIDSLPA